MSLVIEVNNLGKKYRIGGPVRTSRTLVETVGGFLRHPLRRIRQLSADLSQEDSEHVWALRGLNLEVKDGDIVGVVGRNGAGKSTLLKILGRVTTPTIGSARIRGRISSLLEVGTGFHPELTGRENIYLNGAILGMTRKEIARKFDEIVEFAEVAKFIDTPVKRYSSGMYVRLAFSVAASLEPDILIVDEVLAVGDFEFQKKCLGRLHDVSGEGRTVIFVSHNMAAIQRLCSRCILLENGRLTGSADPKTVIKKYLSEDGNQALSWARTSIAVQPAFINSIIVRDHNGKMLSAVTTDSDVALEIECVVSSAIQDLRLGVLFTDGLEQPIFSSSPVDVGEENPTVKGTHIYCVRIPEGILMPAKYFVNVSLYRPSNYREDGTIDRVRSAVVLDVVPVASLANLVDSIRPGMLQIRCQWSHRISQ